MYATQNANQKASLSKLNKTSETIFEMLRSKNLSMTLSEIEKNGKIGTTCKCDLTSVFLGSS